MEALGVCGAGVDLFVNLFFSELWALETGWIDGSWGVCKRPWRERTAQRSDEMTGELTFE
jgi:hypothetical protein